MSDLVKPPEGDIRNAALTSDMLRKMASWPTMPVRYSGKPQDIAAVVLVGHELGIGPMEAINSIYMVNGQISMSGKLMSALVHRAGHQLRVAMDADGAICEAWRRGPDGVLSQVGRTQFDLADAKRAGLDEKDTYKAYPAVMMAWRAISQCCRIYFADCLAGVAYVPEEVDIDAPIEAIPVDEMGAVEVDGVDMDEVAVVEEIMDTLDADVVS